MAGVASYPEGSDPLVSDPEQRLLVKIAHNASSGGGGGGVTIVSSTPVADPGTGPKFAYNQATGEFWVWSGTSWDRLLGEEA